MTILSYSDNLNNVTMLEKMKMFTREILYKFDFPSPTRPSPTARVIFSTKIDI